MMKKISMAMFIMCFMQLKASDSPPMGFSPRGRVGSKAIVKSVSAASQLGKLLQEETVSPRGKEIAREAEVNLALRRKSAPLTKVR